MKRITILVAEDQEIVRGRLRKRLEIARDVAVVGEAEDGFQAVALAKKLHPDIVLMDIAMPLLDGLEATRQMLEALPNTKVLIFRGHNGDAHTNGRAHANGAAESEVVKSLLEQTSVHDARQTIAEL